jgi:hypothetical protein
VLLGGEALTLISSQLSHIAQQAHQSFAQAAVRFKGQRDREDPADPWSRYWRRFCIPRWAAAAPAVFAAARQKVLATG